MDFVLKTLSSALVILIAMVFGVILMRTNNSSETTKFLCDAVTNNPWDQILCNIKYS